MSTYGYLAHHGIKGQKWGIRRYQHLDGSLTYEGIKRYRMNDTNLTSNASRKAAIRRYKDMDKAAQKAAIEKANGKGNGNFSNKKEKKDYIRSQKEGYINKGYQDLFGDKADLNRTRDQSAYLYKKSKNINALRNIGQNAIAGLSLATLGIGVFGGSTNNSGKIYKEIYKSATEKLIKDLDNSSANKITDMTISGASYKEIKDKFNSMTKELSKNRKLLKDEKWMDDYQRAGDDWEKALENKRK